ncbi:endonuclease III-like protein 1 [Anopheles nili]|uniref:endonuclease III-like protein 1 n=1 Tax=Anopheles nili TaxID=185578 RepID=UPI00237A2A66|nr:endonuclease III-like protein 1 [Anopheles nili]
MSSGLRDSMGGTKSPYFSPKKTQNLTKQQGLNLLQKVTKASKSTFTTSDVKSACASKSKINNVSVQISNGYSETKIKKHGNIRKANIRIDAETNTKISVKKSEENLMQPTSTEKTPEKIGHSSQKTICSSENLFESTTAKLAEGTAEHEIKIKLEPPDDVVQTVSEKTPIKQESTKILPPIKRELVDGEDDLNDVKEQKWEPENWRQMMENIRKMRLENLAPVDTMGCDQFSQDTENVFSDRIKRYHCLVSLMLSSQTKDQANYECMLRLKKHGLTPESIAATEDNVLQNLIFPISFYKNKTKFIKQTSQILIDQYEGDIPKNIEDLLKLPGVGKKMAHLCMRSAWNVVTGIGVDTHVHRISNLLLWVPRETKNPEQTRKALEKWLPFEMWEEVNHMLVGFGQTICTNRFPRCRDCLNASICPAFDKQPMRKTPIKKMGKMEDLEF